MTKTIIRTIEIPIRNVKQNSTVDFVLPVGATRIKRIVACLSPNLPVVRDYGYFGVFGANYNLLTGEYIADYFELLPLFGNDTSFIVTAGIAEYVYYASPTNLGKKYVTAEGTSFELVATINVEDDDLDGDFYIYKSLDAKLKTIRVQVSDTLFGGVNNEI